MQIKLGRDIHPYCSQLWVSVFMDETATDWKYVLNVAPRCVVSEPVELLFGTHVPY